LATRSRPAQSIDTHGLPAHETFSPRTKLDKNIYGRVVSRWNDLSLPSKPPEITVFETEITVFETENRERMSDGE
jgi:hypothetical protein